MKYSRIRLSSRIDVADGELMKIYNLNWKFSSTFSEGSRKHKKMENVKEEKSYMAHRNNGIIIV